MVRYIVHKSGSVDAELNDNRAMAEASVLGYVEVEDGNDALARAKRIAHNALGIKYSYMLFWDQTNEYQREIALQRGKIGE